MLEKEEWRVYCRHCSQPTDKGAYAVGHCILTLWSVVCSNIMGQLAHEPQIGHN